jgi:hypothetical protein
VIQRLLAFGPHAGAHRVAGRAGVSILVPLLVLWGIGHLEWSIYAAFGAFASLYGRNHVHLSRARMQLTLGVLLTAATTLGTLVALSEHRDWWAVPAAAAVAAGGSLVSDVQDWHPPGPMFLVFAFAACASVPSDPGDLVPALVVTGASAGFSVLVGGLGATVRGIRGDVTGPPTPGHPHPTYAGVRLHVLRGSIAVLLAGSLATLTGIGHPYWAMVSAVVPLVARDFGQQVVRGLQRLLGTAVGLGLAALLLAVEPQGLGLILVVAALQVAAELLVGRNYAAALVAVTPLALLMVHLAAPVPARALLLDRGVETLIGVVVGVLVGYLTRAPRPSRLTRP